MPVAAHITNDSGAPLCVGRSRESRRSGADLSRCVILETACEARRLLAGEDEGGGAVCQTPHVESATLKVKICSRERIHTGSAGSRRRSDARLSNPYPPRAPGVVDWTMHCRRTVLFRGFDDPAEDFSRWRRFGIRSPTATVGDGACDRMYFVTRGSIGVRRCAARFGSTPLESATSPARTMTTLTLSFTICARGDPFDRRDDPFDWVIARGPSCVLRG